VAGHRAGDPVRAGLVDPEADLLRLPRTCAGVDVGEPLDLPVVEDRVVVTEREGDRATGIDGEVGRLVPRFASDHGELRGTGIDPPIGCRHAACDTQCREGHGTEERRFAQAAQATLTDAMAGVGTGVVRPQAQRIGDDRHR
jgi:hypothetical protein